MKCSQCGTEFEGRFCHECGKPADVSVETDNSSAKQQEANQSSTHADFSNTPVVKTKKPFYKRWWFIALAIIFALGILGKINGGGPTSKYEAFEWSNFALHEKLPEPKSREGKGIYDNSNSLMITVGNTNKDGYKDYVNQCENDYGFIIDKSKSDGFFSASNEENYTAMVHYYDEKNEMSISLSLKK